MEMISREAIAAYEARRLRQRELFLYGSGGPPAFIPIAEARKLQPPRRKRSVKIHRGRRRPRNQNWQYRWREKQRAITLEAIADGRLDRGPCLLCGTKRKEHRIQAHHWDYGKPLDVYFVCQRCHMTVHRVLAAISRTWDSEIKRLPLSIYG